MAGPRLILEPAKVAIRRRVTDLFNDTSKGERPILRRAGAHALARTLGWAYDGSPNHEVWPTEARPVPATEGGQSGVTTSIHWAVSVYCCIWVILPPVTVKTWTNWASSASPVALLVPV